MPESPPPSSTTTAITTDPIGLFGSAGLVHEDDRLGVLGRVTSALTTHVLSASREQSRDAAEQVLSEARAHYSEREAQVQMRCDECGLLSPGASSEERAASSARALGWTVDNTASDCPALCPTCRPDAPKLLPGQVTASVPPALLSAPEVILRDRLRWLVEKMGTKHGTSPRALLINSRASGHRTMLTDFCRGFDYDVLKLEARLEEIEARGVELPPRPEDPERARAWLVGLMEIVRAEDQGSS